MATRKISYRIFSPDKFRGLLAQKNVKQGDLAKFLGVVKQTVSTYANGKSTPDGNLLFRIMAYLGIDDLDEITTKHEETIPVVETEVYA